MKNKALQEAEDAINRAYIERHPDIPAIHFGEADEFILQSIIDGKERFEYDSLNNAAHLEAVALPGVPTFLVIKPLLCKTILAYIKCLAFSNTISYI